MFIRLHCQPVGFVVLAGMTDAANAPHSSASLTEGKWTMSSLNLPQFFAMAFENKQTWNTEFLWTVADSVGKAEPEWLGSLDGSDEDPTLGALLGKLLGPN